MIYVSQRFNRLSSFEEGVSNEENVEKEEEPDEEPKEEEENSSSSEEEGEVDDEEPDFDPWDPICEKVEKDLEESHMYVKEVKRFLDMGKTKQYAENAALNALLPASRSSEG